MMAATNLAVSAPAGTAVCCLTSSFIFNRWQARRESNPQPAVLETAALPIELLAYSRAALGIQSGSVPDPVREQLFHSVLTIALLQNLRDDTGADRAATLTDGEAQAFLHRDWVDQL